MKKLLPPNFKSWIAFYDYMKKEYPDLDSKKTIKLIFREVTPSGFGGNTETKEIRYTIRVDALERLCWREVHGMRLNDDETCVCIHTLAKIDYDDNIRRKAIDLLFRININ